jgi:CRISPR system Cascade subunit CasE
MYISKLQLNATPRCPAVLRDLANPHDLHRTLMRAFPGRSDGGPGRVLFRIEPAAPDRPPTVLVQSDKQPDWSALQGNDQLGDYLLDVDTKPFEPALAAGQRLRFRLRANPTVKRDGKRHALYDEQDQLAWLARKAQNAGFQTFGVVTARKGDRRSRKTDADGKHHNVTHYAVDFEGILEVADPDRLHKALAAGIGPAKAFGCGLLSLATA